MCAKRGTIGVQGWFGPETDIQNTFDPFTCLGKNLLADRPCPARMGYQVGDIVSGPVTNLYRFDTKQDSGDYKPFFVFKIFWPLYFSVVK